MIVTNRVDNIDKKEEKNNNLKTKTKNELVAQALLEYKKHMVNQIFYKEIKEKSLSLQNR